MPPLLFLQRLPYLRRYAVHKPPKLFVLLLQHEHFHLLLYALFWLHRFRKLDVRQKAHRKMLIDTFINAIFLYDDKMVITFNHKEGMDTITFDDLKASSAAGKTGSDLDCLTAPTGTTLLNLNRLLSVVQIG